MDKLWPPEAHQAPLEKNGMVHLESRDVSLQEKAASPFIPLLLLMCHMTIP